MFSEFKLLSHRSVIKSIIYNNKVIVSNFGYMSALQAFGLLLPFITYPYLIRVLGPDLYGKVIFAQSIVGYFGILINFGFYISATKDVSINRYDSDKLSEIFSSVIILKFIIWFVCLLILLCLIMFIPVIRTEYLLYLLTFGFTFNELLFQQYVFLGIEKMKYITYINILSKSFFVLFIFLFVNCKSDYIYVPLLNAIGSFIAGVYALYLVIVNEKIRFRFQSLKTLNYYFRQALPFFMSRVSCAIIERSNTVLIGSFIGYREVSYYDIAQKILTVLLIPYDILNQVVYPRLARTKNMIFVKIILKIVIVTSVLLYITSFVLSKYFVKMLAGNLMINSVLIVKILTLNLVVVSVNYFLGNTTLVVNGFNSTFNKSIIYSSILYLLLVFVMFLFNFFNIYAFAFVVIVVELFSALYRFYFVKKYKLI